MLLRFERALQIINLIIIWVNDLRVDSVQSFNAETEQAAGAQGELIDRWDSDAPQHMPTRSCGLRRRRHLRQLPVTRTCDWQPQSIDPLSGSPVARANQIRF